MIRQLFTARSHYKKRAKSAAIVWTLLIFIACFVPGKEIPDLRVPFADKWVHFILFGGFSFLGRAKDLFDIYADALGSLLGVLLFYICARVALAQDN